VLWGLAAGGRAGKASLPLAVAAREGVRLVGAEAGADGGLDDVGGAQGTVFMRELVLFGLGAAGRLGKALLEDEEEGVAADEDPPQERVCDTEEREDWAVEDFNLRTRFDFAAEGADAGVEGEDVTVTQLGNWELPLVDVGAGRDG